MPLPVADRQPSTDEKLRTLPIVMFALMSGVLMFAGMAVFVGPRNLSAGGSAAGGAGGGVATPANSTNPDLMLMLMGGFIIVGALVYLALGSIAPGMARKSANNTKNDVDRRSAVASVLIITSILRAAACEVPGLVGAFIVLTTGNLLGLVGVGFAAIAIATLLPARMRFERLYRRATETRFGM